MGEIVRSTGVWLRISLGKERQAGGVPVQEITMADRSDLTLCEEPRDRNRSQSVGRGGGIVMRSAEQPPTSATTAEHERAKSRMPMAGSIGRQQDVQVFRG